MGLGHHDEIQCKCFPNDAGDFFDLASGLNIEFLSYKAARPTQKSILIRGLVLILRTTPIESCKILMKKNSAKTKTNTRDFREDWKVTWMFVQNRQCRRTTQWSETISSYSPQVTWKNEDNLRFQLEKCVHPSAGSRIVLCSHWSDNYWIVFFVFSIFKLFNSSP